MKLQVEDEVLWIGQMGIRKYCPLRGTMQFYYPQYPLRGAAADRGGGASPADDSEAVGAWALAVEA